MKMTNQNIDITKKISMHAAVHDDTAGIEVEPTELDLVKAELEKVKKELAHTKRLLTESRALNNNDFSF